MPEKYLTELQYRATKEWIIQVCKKYHPTLSDAQLDKIQWYTQYTWICIEFRVKGYGLISIGIDNHSQKSYKLTGADVTLQDIKEALDSKLIYCRSWRFQLDRLYNTEEIQNSEEEFELPSVTEFYNYYYK